ncbi:NAC domain-containing protein 69 [Raphanus sativus]|uniref:NAC domain-containing protein 69 n=1 Tax=Raphanus sativus TaxID=3726 RepID=A0A6J0LDH4_RAPSA|nr:NAC domain-containing protein 69 [Raphanus sativus]KAJ4876653.1 NAC domain-containing protein 69 [Raphanus sativus]
MERNLVGYRFSPTGEEVINYYLKNKILDKPWLVNEAINEINICAYDPESLPSLSKLESKDLVWYFFTPREYHASEKKKGTKRTTPSGYWKATGVDRKVKDKRGNGVEIGIKKTLVYHHGKSANGVWTPWVMHEYHITSLPPTQRNYVICQVMYKGADGDSLYGNNSNELVSASNTGRVINTTPVAEQRRDKDLYISVDDLANPLNEQDDVSLFNPDTFFNDNYCPYQQPQAPWDDDYINELLSFNGGNYDDVLRDPDITMQEHRNDHRPKKALTGIIVGCSSDSDDAESISATSYQGTSSPDSFHSLSGKFHSSADEIPSLRKDSVTDIQPPAETSINGKTRKSRRTIPSKLEVKESKSRIINASMEKKSSASLSMLKTEKMGWFITEEPVDRRTRKNPPYIYLMNMIIGFILLMAVISNIISVLLSVKT